jgi:hypothetical protein
MEYSKSKYNNNSYEKDFEFRLGIYLLLNPPDPPDD